jgi:hypothetical protein
VLAVAGSVALTDQEVFTWAGIIGDSGALRTKREFQVAATNGFSVKVQEQDK